MPKKIQQVRWRALRAGNEPTPPPGDPRLWTIIEKSLGAVRCLRSSILHIEYPKDCAAPDQTQWSDLLGLPGLHAVELNSARPALQLQVRRKGREADAILSLLRDYFARAGLPEPVELWQARTFDFQDKPGLKDGILKILQLGSKSGVFHAATEEARVLLAADDSSWAQGPEDPGTDLSFMVRQAISIGAGSLLRSSYHMRESRGKAGTNDHLHANALANLVWSTHETKKNGERPAEAPPIGFVGGLPKTADTYSDLEKFHRKCEFVASHYDRSVGLVSVREQTTACASFDVLSPLPVSSHPLAPVPGQSQSLYMIGPWDARNSLMERRIEWLSKKISVKTLSGGELLDGDVEWTGYVLHHIASSSGWVFEASALRALMRGAIERNRYSRLLLLWLDAADQKTMTEQTKLFHVPFLKLGTPDISGKLSFAGESVNPLNMTDVSQLAKSAQLQSHSLQWNYPDVKSTTYGYDRVMRFPDQYLLRVASRDSNQREWYRRAWYSHSGDRFRSVTMRKLSASPSLAFCWSDGVSNWGESMGSQEGWTDVDPRQAGVASVDAAMRGLVALGANPRAGGVARVWMPLPELSGEDHNDSQWAAYILALEGVSQACRDLGFHVESQIGGGVSFPGARQELLVNLSCRIPPENARPVPGFRMDGEVLYAVGHKPSFVDTGSRILRHVRVISNYCSRLDIKQQLELYETLHSLIAKGVITSIRPIYEGGLAVTLGEMALWSGMGAQLRPTTPVIEIFSGAPGRLVVGILPQHVKLFESVVKAEMFTILGTVTGDKLFSMTLRELRESLEHEDLEKEPPAE